MLNVKFDDEFDDQFEMNVAYVNESIVIEIWRNTMSNHTIDVNVLNQIDVNVQCICMLQVHHINETVFIHFQLM